MTGCYICDTPMEDVKLDPRDGKIRPCSHCENIVQELVQEWDREYELPYIDSELDEYYEIYNPILREKESYSE